MALPPEFIESHVIEPVEITWGEGQLPSLHNLEIYLDFTCPNSARFFDMLTKHIIPILCRPKYTHRVKLIFRHFVQPWHPASVIMHEVVLAASLLSPGWFWENCACLFQHQQEFSLSPVANELRNETYKRLIKVLIPQGPNVHSSWVKRGEEMYNLLHYPCPSELAPSKALEEANEIASDLKLVIKATRQMGIHECPVAALNGIVVSSRELNENTIKKEWVKWINENIGENRCDPNWEDPELEGLESSDEEEGEGEAKEDGEGGRSGDVKIGGPSLQMM